MRDRGFDACSTLIMVAFRGTLGAMRTSPVRTDTSSPMMGDR